MQRLTLGVLVAVMVAGAAKDSLAQAPYSLPWQLRPVAPGNAVRLESTLAFHEAAMGDGETTVPVLVGGGYKVRPDLALLVRAGSVTYSPATGDGSTAFVNPVLAALYGLNPTPELRIGLFLGVTVPVGMGGGNDPDVGAKAARSAGILARSAMDNAMFAVNDLTVFPGAGVAWVKHGLTLQAEVTVLQLTRVRGDGDQPDSSKTNFTSGFHVGYFVVPALSVSAELRYQRWLSTPAAVEADPTGTIRDNLTVAAGVRYHAKLGDTRWLRPGVAYARALDDPMSARSYDLVLFDVLFAY